MQAVCVVDRGTRHMQAVLRLEEASQGAVPEHYAG